MNAFGKKLRGNQGASVLIALVIFLICATAAAIVLSSSVSNAQGVNAHQARQQAYLDVSSAAKMFASDMDDQRPHLFGVITEKSYACPYQHDDAGVQDIAVSLRNGEGGPVDQTALMGLISRAVHEINPADDSSCFGPTDFTVEVQGCAPVSGTFYMDAGYNIDLHFQLADGRATSQYALDVHIPASAPLDEASRSVASEEHRDVWNWSSQEYVVKAKTEQGWGASHAGEINEVTGDIEPASNDYGYSSPSSYDVVLSSQQASVVWGDPVFSKGEVA